MASSTRYNVDWRSRNAETYLRQDRAFLHFVETGQYPRIGATCWDGYCAAVVAEAGVRTLKEGRKMPVTMIAKPEFYA